MDQYIFDWNFQSKYFVSVQYRSSVVNVWLKYSFSALINSCDRRRLMKFKWVIYFRTPKTVAVYLHYRCNYDVHDVRNDPLFWKLPHPLFLKITPWYWPQRVNMTPNFYKPKKHWRGLDFSLLKLCITNNIVMYFII